MLLSFYWFVRQLIANQFAISSHELTALVFYSQLVSLANKGPVNLLLQIGTKHKPHLYFNLSRTQQMKLVSRFPKFSLAIRLICIKFRGRCYIVSLLKKNISEHYICAHLSSRQF